MHFEDFSIAKHCDFAAGNLATCCVLLVRAVSNLLASSFLNHTKLRNLLQAVKCTYSDTARLLGLQQATYTAHETKY